MSGRKIFFGLLDLLLWAALAYLLVSAFTYHVGLSTFPYQIYLTEGGDLQSTRALQQGLDPWAPSQAPEYCNLYGIGYPWFAAQVSRLAPTMDLLVLMRLVSAGWIFLALGVLLLALREARTPWLPAVACCAAVYATLLFSVDAVAARPDAMVLALLLLSVVWTLRPGQGDALFAGALAGSLYFVKPTGLLALVLVVVLYALQGRYRRGFTALAAGLASLAVLVAWMLWRHPLFFEGTFAVQFHRRDFNWDWMWRQWQNLFYFNKPWELALGLGALWVVLRRKPWFPQGPWRLWAGVAGVVFAALAAGPGGHRGAWLDYYNQLLLPFLFLAGTLWLLAQDLSPRWVALALLLNGALVLGVDQFYVPPISAAQVHDWDEADAWVARYPYGLYPSMLTSILARRGGFVADNDHTHGLEFCYWGSHTQLKDANLSRNADIDKTLAQGRFQTLLCGGSLSCPSAAELGKMGYVEARRFHLATIYNRGILDLVAYLPKKILDSSLSVYKGHWTTRKHRGSSSGTIPP